VSGNRNYRVFVEERRYVEVDVNGVASEEEAKEEAIKAASGTSDKGFRVRRDPLGRRVSSAHWLNNPSIRPMPPQPVSTPSPVMEAMRAEWTWDKK
jgi:hypothetical protein